MKKIYNRILIKLSGKALCGNNDFGFCKTTIDYIVDEIVKVKMLDTEIAIVVGGGNIFRGSSSNVWNISQPDGDNIGMLGTVLNGLMIHHAFVRHSFCTKSSVMSSISMELIIEKYVREKSIEKISKGEIVIFVGGIGQPFVSTDYTGVQRALENSCDAILVAKDGVEGAFSTDPKKDPNAEFIASLSYDEIISKDLKIMDQTSILLAKKHSLPIHVFNFNKKNSILNICCGDNVGSIISR